MRSIYPALRRAAATQHRLFATGQNASGPSLTRIGVGAATCGVLGLGTWYYVGSVQHNERIVKDALLDVLRSGSIIVKVGAGFSRPAGLPTFPSFLAEVAYACDIHIPEEMVARANMDQLVQLQFDITRKVGKPRMVAAMREVLDVDAEGELAMAGRVDALLALPSLAIVSENWDGILDKHCKVRHLTPGDLFEWLTNASPTDRKCLLKLQGSLSDIDSVCVSAEDCATVADARHAFNKRVFNDHRVLHIGLRCESGDNPERARRAEDAIAPRHFAILPAWEVDEQRRRELLEKDNMGVLTFDVAQGADGLESILRELQNDLQQRRK